ncbi:uncharacterized protein CCR75_007034 [Bremia lactucae]|uniref:DIS3-like exonuclease 1 n=1 Tax=Bremia lactucae TaxID=4779 RepID=A0A976NZF3_BRELC|nr:hypothetical protein CCR75_007034 [Bremia lactucae]
MAWQLRKQEDAHRLCLQLQQQQQEDEELKQLRVENCQHGGSCWKDVRTDVSFVERSRHRKYGAMKSQERYLRRDVHCGVDSCSSCRKARALLPNKVLPRVDDGEYVVPDAFSLLQCMELLEEESLFFRAVPHLLVLESVFNVALRLASSRDASRLRKFFKHDHRTGQNSIYLFPDQHHVETYIEPMAMNEMQDLRVNQAVLKTVVWYVTQGHLPPSAKVVYMSRNIDAVVSLQLAATINAHVVSCECLLKERLPTDSKELTTLLELATNAADAVEYEQAHRCPDEKGNIIGRASEFKPHLKVAMINDLLAQPSSQILAGKLEVSRHNPMEAYVVVDGPQAIDKVFVCGRVAMNRGVHGDRVAVEAFHSSMWRTPQSDHMLVHYTQDEHEHELESGSIEFRENKHKLRTIPTGHVVSILSRSPKQHVATIIASTVNAGDDYALAVPMDWRLPKIRIRSQRLDVLIDKRLRVVIDSWAIDSLYPNGHYVGVLGPAGSLQTELSALLVDHDVDQSPFCEAALACLPSSQECPIDIEGSCVAECSTAKRSTWCKLLNWKVPEHEVLQRRDLRQTHRIFSVDPPGCQDIDDAMSIRCLPNGNLELGVHIADVSYFVKHGSALDLEGRRRGTTVYLVAQRLDMLPSVLSADLCSLHENRDRFAVSVMWELDGTTYDVVEHSTWFGRTVIRNCASMTYEQAHRLLQGNSADVNDASRRGLDRVERAHDHVEGVTGGRIPLSIQKDLREDLRIITDVGRQLSRMRGSQGGLDLSKQEEMQITINVSELGHEDVRIATYKSLEIHSTIAELMIFANSTVAHRLMQYYPTHAFLRHHPSPSGDRFTELVELAKARDVVIDATNNFTLQQSLAAAEKSNSMDSKTMALFKSLAVRVMTEAAYVSSGEVVAADIAMANGDDTRIAHYGLGLQYYTHFTSPIRRYADVIVHRQLLASIKWSWNCKSTSQRSAVSISTTLALPRALVPSVLSPQDDEEYLDNLLSSINNQLLVSTSATAATNDVTTNKDNMFTPKELVSLAQHLNEKHRQAKLAARACDELFLALYFSTHTVKVPAIITALKENGFIVFVPKYDIRAPVYLRDKNCVVQMNPLILGVPVTDTDPATGVFAGTECIRQIPQAHLILTDSDREMLEVVASGDKRTMFQRLDEVEVQVSCDLAASGARVPQLQLLLINRATSTLPKHVASSRSELDRFVQTKSEMANKASSCIEIEADKVAQENSMPSLYHVLHSGPYLPPSTKWFASPKSGLKKDETQKNELPNLKSRGPGRFNFGNFSIDSRRHYQHKLTQYVSERSQAREEELSIQRYAADTFAMTSVQEVRRAEREALSRTQKLASEKRHDRINRRNKADR